jgi:hypothetical protein
LIIRSLNVVFTHRSESRAFVAPPVLASFDNTPTVLSSGITSANGVTPVAISYNTHPSAHMSTPVPCASLCVCECVCVCVCVCVSV